MKTLGIIGGMSWESTALYYAALNRGMAEKLGGLHSAKLLIASVNFLEIVELQQAGRWDEAGSLLANISSQLVGAGAQAIALAVNTMHKVAPQIQAAVDVPFIDIRDVIASTIRSLNATKVGLLGTRYVVEQPFYGDHIEIAGGCEIMRPNVDDNLFVHHVIYDELCRGTVTESSRGRILDILKKLHDNGAECVVLGCTELPMLHLDDQSPIPLIDSTALHVEACLSFMTANK